MTGENDRERGSVHAHRTTERLPAEVFKTTTLAQRHPHTSDTPPKCLLSHRLARIQLESMRL